MTELPGCLIPRVDAGYESYWLDTGCVRDRGAVLNVAREEHGMFLFGVWMRARAGRVLGIDSETNAVYPWDPAFRLRTVQVADAGTTWVIVVEDLDPASVLDLCELIRGHRTWVGQYCRNEINFLGRGLPAESFRMDDDRPHIIDLQTLLSHYDPRTVMPEEKDGIDPRLPHLRGLKDTATRELSPVLAEIEDAMHARFHALAPKGHRAGKEKPKKWGFANIPSTDPWYLAYSGLDPLMTVRLYEKLASWLRERKPAKWRLLVEVDWPTQWDADRAMYRGMPVDGPYARWLNTQLQNLMDFNAGYLAQFGIGPSGSGPKVGEALASLGAVSAKRTKPTAKNPDGNVSWDKDVIKELITNPETPAAARALAETLQAVRKASKYRSTWVQPMLDALDFDGRVHADLRVCGTVTGRMAGRDPALQNLPKKDTRIRAAYTALPGHVLVSCDLSQGEPRTMAGLSGDRALLAMIQSGDLNNELAAATFPGEFDPAEGKKAGTRSYLIRQSAKMAFLAWCYGAGIGTVARALGGTVEQAVTAVNNWRSSMTELAALKDRLDAQAVVTLESGRECPLWDRYTVGASGELLLRPRPSRKGLNYATQGSQRDILVRAWRQLVEWGWGRYLYFFVHDEILLSVPEALAEQTAAALKAAMTMDFHGVPIECEATIEGWTWLAQPEEFGADSLETDAPEFAA